MTKDSEVLPGTVFTPRGVRILKIAVAILTALLLAGIAALFYGVTLQVSKLGHGSKPQADAAPVAAAAAPAPGATSGHGPYTRLLDLGLGQLSSVVAVGDLIVLHWKGEAGDVVISIDPRSGNEAGRIQIPRR